MRTNWDSISYFGRGSSLTVQLIAFHKSHFFSLSIRKKLCSAYAIAIDKERDLRKMEFGISFKMGGFVAVANNLTKCVVSQHIEVSIGRCRSFSVVRFFKLRANWKEGTRWWYGILL